jgi:hypothetical protein
VVEEDLGEYQQMLNQVDQVAAEVKDQLHQLVEHQEPQIKVMLVVQVVQVERSRGRAVVQAAQDQHQWLAVQV